jgi:hypothetical protein
MKQRYCPDCRGGKQAFQNQYPWNLKSPTEAKQHCNAKVICCYVAASNVLSAAWQELFGFTSTRF